MIRVRPDALPVYLLPTALAGAVAVLGVVAAVLVALGRRRAAGRRRDDAVLTLQRSVWRAATLAAARGHPTELHLVGAALEVRDASGDGRRVLQRFVLDGLVASNLPGGRVLAFAPPGRVDRASLAALPDPLWLKTTAGEHRLRISRIGEIQAEAVR